MQTQISILDQLQAIRNELAELKLIKKEVLNLEETCEYLSISSSHLYKLTCTHQIPCYQPNGKKLYFKRTELEVWLLRNRKHASDEIEQLASDYIIRNGKKKGGLL